MAKQNTAITAAWGSSSSLFLYQYAHKAGSKAHPAQLLPNFIPPNMTHLETKFIFDMPVLHSLLAEANSLFHDLQDRSQQLNLPQSEYLKISQSYRCIIRKCLQKLQCEAENETDVDAKSQIIDYITVFYSIECIWHLCEIFAIQTTPSNLIVPQLIEWARFHFPRAEQLATGLVINPNDDSGDAEQYLSVVKALVVQGHLDIARTILHIYGRSQFNSIFSMVDDILRSVPIYNANGGLPLQNWRSQWQYWVTDVESKIQMGCFASHPELEEIISLVTGNETAWTNLIRESTCWYEYLPGFLFYTQPNCTYAQLGTFAENWLRRWMYAMNAQLDDNNDTSLKHLDRVILMLMQNDFHQILSDIQNMCDQQWFATHLTDLLWHCGKLSLLNKDHTESSDAFRDSLLLEFGSMLMSKNSLWEFGIGYLQQCPSDGFDAIETLLPKVTVQNEKQAFRVINVAKSLGLVDVDKEICRVQAVQCFKNEHYGNALDWALRSQDTNTVSTITDYFLKHYVETGKILCHDVISKAGAKIFISPRLVFLAKYYDFHCFYRSKQLSQAAELLVNLLDSKIAPEYFLTPLFIDTLPMLETAEPIFSTNDTYKIMHYLETQFVAILERRDTDPDVMASEEKSTANKNTWEIVELIRRACARNLSRALAIENTII